jgi:adenylate cyclase
MMTSPNRPRMQFAIGGVLAFGFGGLILMAIAAVFYLGVSSNRENTRELLGYVTDQSIDSLVQRIDDLLQPALEQTRWISGEIEAGRIDPAGDKETFDRSIMGTSAAVPQFRLTYFVSPDQKLTLYDRQNRTVRTMDMDENPTAVERYRRLRDVTRPTWDEPYWSPTLQQTVVFLASPLARDGKPVGFIGQAITISSLSLQIAAKGEQLGIVPYILYGTDRVLAHPSLIGWQPLNGEADALPRLDRINDAVLREIWNKDLRFDASFFVDLSHSEGFGVDLDGRRYVFVQRRMDNYGSVPWTVGAYIPTTVVRDLRTRLINVVVGTVGILILATLVAAWIGRMTSRPVQRLAGAARQIRSGALDEVPTLPPSTLREMDEAASAFNDMVAGMRERDRIRSVFGKYVPERIAARLLADEGGLVPVLTEATVLFIDLEGFTELSETLHPAEIVEMLNAYFSVVGEIIERHDGVITQFQGDAILATFNVPARHPEHAAQAVRAAIEISHAVAGRRFAGHELKYRIGINTGELVAGAVGAQDRLNYTVHGDMVNTAARLEQMNKELGTRILVAETAVRLAPDFPYRKVGALSIRGKTDSVTVYAINPEDV